MATAPRPLTADSAIVAAPGPKARSVTMRRSKPSAAMSPSPFGRGQNSAAAMNSDGSMKKNWLAAKNVGRKIWSNQPRTGAARCSA